MQCCPSRAGSSKDPGKTKWGRPGHNGLGGPRWTQMFPKNTHLGLGKMRLQLEPGGHTKQSISFIITSEQNALLRA